MQRGDKFVIVFDDKSTAKVYISRAPDYMPNGSILFKYEEEETNRQLITVMSAMQNIADFYLSKTEIKYRLENNHLIPISNVYKKVESVLEVYVNNTFKEEERKEALEIFKNLSLIAGEDYIINTFFNETKL